MFLFILTTLITIFLLLVSRLQRCFDCVAGLISLADSVGGIVVRLAGAVIDDQPGSVVRRTPTFWPLKLRPARMYVLQLTGLSPQERAKFCSFAPTRPVTWTGVAVSCSRQEPSY